MNPTIQRIVELQNKEDNLKLDTFRINEVSIWRVVRFGFRVSDLKKTVSFTNKTKPSRFNLANFVFNYFLSMWQFLKIIVIKPQIDILLVPFPRLTKIEDVYLDKFTDPIIDQFPQKKVLIAQRSLGGNHFSPRRHSAQVFKTEFINITPLILAVFFTPLFFLKHHKKLTGFFASISHIYSISLKKRVLISYKLTAFFLEVRFSSWLLKNTQCPSIIGVSRTVFAPLTVAGKKLNIKSFELQHGITSNVSTLYHGNYNESIDVDHFLVFGSYWVNSFFGIPPDKIHNIGWAYKDYIDSKTNSDSNYSKKKVLLISSPAITNQVLELALLIDSFDINYQIDIRLHPQENLNLSQQNIIASSNFLNIADSSIDSTIAVAKYDKIIGDNSTVLFEALSLNKVVGKLNMLDIKSRNLNDDLNLGFFMLNDKEQLYDYLNDSLELEFKVDNNIYSDFNKELFNKLIS